jgi:hypothetical protein
MRDLEQETRNKALVLEAFDALLNEARAMVERARACVAALGVPSTGEHDVINQDRE